jgi:hypothetical protein
MIQPTDKKPTNMQLNLNTWLLAICMGLSSWVLYSINQLDSEIAGMMPLINTNSSAVQSINSVNKEQSEKISELSDRIIKLETIMLDHSQKN